VVKAMLIFRSDFDSAVAGIMDAVAGTLLQNDLAERLKNFETT